MRQLNPDARSSTLKTLAILSGPCFAAVVLFLLPSASDVLSEKARWTAAIAAWMAAWWITEAVALEATALLPLALFPVFNIASLEETAAPYATDIVVLFFGGLLLGRALERWGLHKRAALATIALLGTSPPRIVLGFLVATAFVSMWVSNTASAMMMLPIGISVSRSIVSHLKDVGSDSRGTVHLPAAIMLAIAFGGSIGGVGTIIGTPPVTQYVGYMGKALGITVTFFDWLKLGIPLVILGVAVAWLVLTKVAFRVHGKDEPRVRAIIASERKELGPMTWEEWVTLGAFSFAALAWVVLPLLKMWPAINTKPWFLPFGRVSDAGIALIASLPLFLIPAAKRIGPRRPILTWDDASQVPWGVLIITGGGLTLASAIKRNGLDQFVAMHSQGLVDLPLPLVVLILTLAATFLSEVMSNTALTAVALPIAAALAKSMGVPEPALLAPVMLGASLAFMLPAGTPPNAIVFSSGLVSIREMCRAGMWLNISFSILTSGLVWVGVKLSLLPGLAR